MAFVIDEKLKEQVIAKLKSGKSWTMRQCSMCGYPCNFNSDGEKLYFDAGCDCVTYTVNEPRSWEDLDFYFNPEYGHLKALQAWVSTDARERNENATTS